MASTTPQPYGNPSGTAAVPASEKYNVLAIVGFILAFLVSVAGLVISIIAFTQIKRTGERGRGLALAGIIIGALSLVLGIVGFIILSSAAAHTGTTTY